MSEPCHDKPVNGVAQRAHIVQELRCESRGQWTSWAVRPNEPSGFRGRKDLLNRALAWSQLVPNMSTDI